MDHRSPKSRREIPKSTKNNKNKNKNKQDPHRFRRSKKLTREGGKLTGMESHEEKEEERRERERREGDCQIDSISY